jgi:hypothetical protein
MTLPLRMAKGGWRRSLIVIVTVPQVRVRSGHANLGALSHASTLGDQEYRRGRPIAQFPCNAGYYKRRSRL